jgi:DNA-binding response OmpR family regulator
MNRILIIEDDPVTATIYRQMFQRLGYHAETALDGRSGLEQLASMNPDAVLLDLMLPGMDGLDVLRQIRAQAAWRDLPVIAFSNGFLGDMLHEAELSGATATLTKFDHTPWQVIERVRYVIEHGSASRGPGRPGDESRPGAAGGAPDERQPSAVLAAERPAGAVADGSLRVPAAAGDSTQVDASFRDELRAACLRSAPATIESMRQMVLGFARNPRHRGLVGSLFASAHSLAGSAALADLPMMSRFTGAIEGLVKILMKRPEQINISTLRTLDQALDALVMMVSAGGDLPAGNLAEPRVLVVDDDEIALRSVRFALEKARFSTVCVSDPTTALRMLGVEKIDLAFLDVELPLMSGTDLCAHLRRLPGYEKLPVVFITYLSDFEEPVRTELRGGDDLMAKPFLYMELALKAFALIVKRRLQASEV